VRLKDRTGMKFGRLIVLSRAPNLRNLTIWNCRCDCGKEILCRGVNLDTGNTKSCGCAKIEAFTKRVRKHGMSLGTPGGGHPIYRIWKAIRERCNCRTNSSYKYYGKRGITVCKRWDSFELFLMDMGPRPVGSERYCIERIDNNGNYEPTNCRWATFTEQARNTRRTVYVEVNGERIPITAFAEMHGVKAGDLHYRISIRGMTPQNALWHIKNKRNGPKSLPLRLA